MHLTRYDVEGLAVLTGKKESTIKAWLDATALPTYDDIQLLCNKLELGAGVFFEPFDYGSTLDALYWEEE